MRLRLFQIDAFTGRVFAGNPAAVVPLDSWLDDSLLQAIAAENNLSETAFLVGGGGQYEIRWMTPMVEVDLCGHATLASAWVVFEVLEPGRVEVAFRSRGGRLQVTREEGRLALDFPARPSEPASVSPALIGGALGRVPREVWSAPDLIAIFESEDDVRALRPDMGRIADVTTGTLTATAPGHEVDFVSRVFAPAKGVPEDPVTGSAHCALVPFWSRRLGRKRLHARQVSARGGELFCEDRGERVTLAGSAVKYLEGTIEI